MTITIPSNTVDMIEPSLHDGGAIIHFKALDMENPKCQWLYVHNDVVIHIQPTEIILEY